MMDDLPPVMTPEQAAEFRRRRRARNWATLLLLFALSALFFAITLVKMGHHG